MVVGFTLNCPCDCAVADPLNAIVRLGFEAFEEIATLPLKLPADSGAKFTLNETLCPGVNVMGMLTPEIVKPVPLAAISLQPREKHVIDSEPIA